MFYIYFLYYIAGVIQDFSLTMNWRFINKEKALPAGFFSFLTTIITMTVLYNILTQLNSQRSIIAIMVYALGIATGTILAMKTKMSS